MNRKKPKQFLELLNKPILVHTLEVFETSDVVSEIILIVPSRSLEYCRRDIVNRYNLKKVVKIIAGGRKRQDSVYQGLRQINDNCQVVIIHDGVRPFISHQMINDSIQMAQKYKASIFALPVKETVKKIGRNDFVVRTLRREELVLVQTPQAFEFGLINRAYDKAFKDKFYGTDDAMLVERLGGKVKVLKGSDENIKITTPQDLITAEIIQRAKAKSSKSN